MNIAEDTSQNLTNSTPIFNFPPGLNSVPSQNTLPWHQGPPQYVPWGHSPNSPPAQLVTFNAQPYTSNMSFGHQNDISFGQSLMNNVCNSQPIASTSNFGHTIISTPSNQCGTPISSVGHKPILHCKRKASLDFPVPSKQHITEEKMAQHMSRLHISSESQPEPLLRGEIENSTDRQKRLYVCEEMRRLQTESILPSVLLGRLERPCMAVMLWQPPSKIPELIGSTQSLTNSAVSSAVAQTGSYIQTAQLAASTTAEDENDNDAGTIDLNNMDMEDS